MELPKTDNDRTNFSSSSENDRANFVNKTSSDRTSFSNEREADQTNHANKVESNQPNYSNRSDNDHTNLSSKPEKKPDHLKDLAAQFFLQDLDNEISGTFALSIVVIATLVLTGFFRFLLGALFDFDWLNPYSQVMLMLAVFMIALLFSGLTIGIFARIRNRRYRDKIVKIYYAMANHELPMWRDFEQKFAKIARDTIGRNVKNAKRSDGYDLRDFWVECPIIERYVAIQFPRKVAKMLRSEFEKLASQWFLCFGLWSDAERFRHFGVSDAARYTERELDDAITLYRMLCMRVEKECAAAVRQNEKKK